MGKVLKASYNSLTVAAGSSGPEDVTAISNTPLSPLSRGEIKEIQQQPQLIDLSKIISYLYSNYCLENNDEY